MNTLDNLVEPLQKNLKNTWRPSSPLYDHYNTTGHATTVDNFSMVGMEEKNHAWSVKEAIFIWVNDPSLNKNIGNYQLPHIWDEVLVSLPEPKLK